MSGRRYWWQVCSCCAVRPPRIPSRDVFCPRLCTECERNSKRISEVLAAAHDGDVA